MGVRVSVEGKRGCGWRKPGGLYLVAPKLDEPCSLLPVEMSVCPCCGEGIRPARGWTWIDPGRLLPARYHDSAEHNATCPLGGPDYPDGAHRMGERCGLIWIGEGYYPTVESFAMEAEQMGVSRRITSVPRGFVVRETWVAFGHRKAIPDGYRIEGWVDSRYATLTEATEVAAWNGLKAEKVKPAYKPGVFTVVRPTAIEYVVRPEDEDDDELLESFRKRGIEPVKVVRAEESTPLADVA